MGLSVLAFRSSDPALHAGIDTFGTALAIASVASEQLGLPLVCTDLSLQNAFWAIHKILAPSENELRLTSKGLNAQNSLGAVVESVSRLPMICLSERFLSFARNMTRRLNVCVRVSANLRWELTYRSREWTSSASQGNSCAPKLSQRFGT